MSEIQTLVDTHRKALASQRRINDTGHGSSLNALLRHGRTMKRIENELLALGCRALVGLLVEERALAFRLDKIKAEGGPNRPELHSRLRQTRRDLRALAAVTVAA